MGKWVLTLLCLMPAPLWACAVCGFGNDKTRSAYIATTGLLSLVPLLMIFGGGTFLYRKLKQSERDSEQNSNH